MNFQPGLDRPVIKQFVRAFYNRVRRHDILGPIFEEKLAENWDAHIETLTNFWMTVLGGVAAYKGNPFAAHQQLPDLRPEHFPMWLQLFSETAVDELPSELAALAEEKANRIADSLRQGLFFRTAVKSTD